MHGLQSSGLHRHVNSAEENVGEKQGQVLPHRDAVDYASAPSAKGPSAGVYAGTEAGLQSCDSGDAFRNEEYLSGHGQSGNF